MRITLAVTEGPHQGQKFSFSAHDTFLVGRSRRAHFRLPEKDRYFSRIHFLIEVNPPCCRLMDMGSRNGTYVNGEKVEIADLKNADQIKAGRTVIQVRVEENERPLSGDNIEALPELPDSLGVTPPPRSTRNQPGRCRVCECHIQQTPNATPQLICSDCNHQIRAQEQFIDGYQLVRPLGQGAMGIVYLALRKLDYRLVALKTIIPAVAGSTTQVERFLREVEILRKLSHPHIVSFRETGEASGRLFFAMDYIRGSDAHRLLRTQGVMPIDRAVRMICQLLDALGYAHDLGFVHRDIKPSNMLVTEENGREMVKLADFGLARVYQSSQMSGLTVTGDFGGTVAFMAPEQITEYRDAKPHVDQYAAAASLYNLLTNQYVYDLPPDLTKQLYLVLHEDCIPIRQRRPDIPQGLADVIERALAREVDDRFPHVRDFQAALLPFSS